MAATKFTVLRDLFSVGILVSEDEVSDAI